MSKEPDKRQDPRAIALTTRRFLSTAQMCLVATVVVCACSNNNHVGTERDGFSAAHPGASSLRPISPSSSAVQGSTTPVASTGVPLCAGPTTVIAYASQPTSIQGAWEFGIGVTNNSSAPCVLDGYPKVFILGGSSPTPAKAGATDFGDDRPIAITLPTGKSAAFNLQLGPAASPETCASAKTIEVGLPGGVGTTNLPLPAVQGPTGVCTFPATVSAFYPPVY